MECQVVCDKTDVDKKLQIQKRISKLATKYFIYLRKKISKYHQIYSGNKLTKTFFCWCALFGYLYFSEFSNLTRIGYRNWSWHGWILPHFHLVYWKGRYLNPQSRVRWSLGVNFTNILQAHLCQYSNKKFNLYWKHRKTSCKTFVQKKPHVKCWWNWPQTRPMP